MTQKFTVRIPSAAQVDRNEKLQNSVIIQHNEHHHAIVMVLSAFKKLANKVNPMDYLLTLKSVESEGLRFVPEGQKFYKVPTEEQGEYGELFIMVAQYGNQVAFTQASMRRGEKLSGRILMHCDVNEFLDLLAEVRNA